MKIAINPDGQVVVEGATCTEIERPGRIGVPLSKFAIHDEGEYFPLCGMDANGGWGYDKEDAAISTDITTGTGIRNENRFINYRSGIEVSDYLNAFLIDIVKCRQELKRIDNHRYDVVRFNVYVCEKDDYIRIRKEYGHNDETIPLHSFIQQRIRRLQYYTSECWINIDSFFGRTGNSSLQL